MSDQDWIRRLEDDYERRVFTTPGVAEGLEEALRTIEEWKRETGSDETRTVEVTVGSLSAKDEERVVMDRPALRRFLDEWPFCGCGCPEVAAGTLLRLLRLHPMYEHEHYLDFEEWIGDEGARHLLLYALDGKGLAEHGGLISLGWLTDKGMEVRDALAREEADGFEALFAEHCAHGYDVDDEEHDCMAFERSEQAD